jgi:hypothetical protein
MQNRTCRRPLISDVLIVILFTQHQTSVQETVAFFVSLRLLCTYAQGLKRSTLPNSQLCFTIDRRDLFGRSGNAGLTNATRLEPCGWHNYYKGQVWAIAFYLASARAPGTTFFTGFVFNYDDACNSRVKQK